MPGRYFLTRDLSEVTAALGLFEVPDDIPRRNIAPGENVLTVTSEGATQMRWGIIPVGRKNARGRPVMETIVNARSETVFEKSAFHGVKRAVVPMDGWYEWTGERRKKTAWSITAKDGGLLFFAAIFDVWHAPGGMQVSQVATVTCEPSADVRKIHHRMGVLLTAADVPIWLGQDLAAAAGLMKPFPDGSLQVREVLDVDWSQP